MKGPAIDTFTSELRESGEAVFAPNLTGTVEDVLVPNAAVFIMTSTRWNRRDALSSGQAELGGSR